MNLIPIRRLLKDNPDLIEDPSRRFIVQMTVDFYKKVGYVEPWIGYSVEKDGNIVGSAGFKGPPVNGSVEIAYGTEEPYRNMGIGKNICKLLVDIARRANPSIRIAARTIEPDNHSTRILKSNGFVSIGTVVDPEDGEVWEWELNAT